MINHKPWSQFLSHILTKLLWSTEFQPSVLPLFQKFSIYLRGWSQPTTKKLSVLSENRPWLESFEIFELLQVDLNQPIDWSHYYLHHQMALGYRLLIGWYISAGLRVQTHLPLLSSLLSHVIKHRPVQSNCRKHHVIPIWSRIIFVGHYSVFLPISPST